MTILCVIRHGETDWNTLGKFQGREDIELNENGKQQAKNCIEYLKGGGWTKVISSPLIRARQTANIFAHALELGEVEIYPDLIEMDFGSASGLLPVERESRFPNGLIPDQESEEEVVARTVKELDMIHQKYPNDLVIIVTHGMVISSLLSHLSNGEMGADYRELKNTCVNILKRNEPSWDIELYNHSVQAK